MSTRVKNKYFHNYVVLLAGGEGSRFWPRSRTLEPKQFLSLFSEESLFENTLRRVLPLFPPKNIFVMTSVLYKHQIYELLRAYNIPQNNVILEESPKNTAPCIGVAARLIFLKDPDARICVCPCDHLITDKRQFIKLLSSALMFCNDSLLIFGIPPNRPETGYGYIKVDSTLHLGDSAHVFSIERFCEKPNLAKAKILYKDKRCFWNSGIFVGSCKIFLNELNTCLPALYNQLLHIHKTTDVASVWKKFDTISFDYGVVEKSNNVKMLQALELGWSDLGSWQAWDELLKKDRNGNYFKGDVISLESRNTTVFGQDRLIAAIGLDDLIVVDTKDALLVTKKSKSQEVKNIFNILRNSERQEYYNHLTVKRPWGNYTVVNEGLGFKIKLVEVFPHRSLSLQFHKKRSEHWVVVEGTAKVTKGEETILIKKNESIFIPSRCIHCLSNPTSQVLKIVEVQSGNILSENDIIRLKDDFGRSSGTKK